jgi:UDP-N-acetylglucosamine 2-epimerase
MPLINLVTNLSSRNNSLVECQAYADFQKQWQGAFDVATSSATVQAELPALPIASIAN